MQEIIAKIEQIIFDFKKQNENKLELHHIDVLNSFSEKERFARICFRVKNSELKTNLKTNRMYVYLFTKYS